MSDFDQLALTEALLRAVHASGYETATPIQLQAIPPVMAGKDLMGCAQTGTGKTAAFALPTLHRLSTSFNAAPASQPVPAASKRKQKRGSRDSFPRADRRPIRALILAPTRELALQIGQSFKTYGQFTGMRYTCVYGGVGQGMQVRDLERGVDVLVATPGRLLDLMDQGYINLRKVEILVLDEADQMLDMGFIIPLRKIVAAVPAERQTLMFSATMPPEIRKLASEWLTDPVNIQVGQVASPVELVEQSVYHVEKRNKPQLLTHYIENNGAVRTIVFSRTKHGADKIVRYLSRDGIRAAAIHGNKSQNARQRALADFKSNRPPVLVATDIAARGIDVSGVSHVINYDLPDMPEVYVHRIGRTGRAGAKGVATTFCARDERDQLRQIERLTRKTLRVEQKQPEYKAVAQPARENHETRETHGDGENRHHEDKQGHHSAPHRERGMRPGQQNSGKPRRRRRPGQLAGVGAGPGAGAGGGANGGGASQHRRGRRRPGKANAPAANGERRSTGQRRNAL